ncbi:hypothetical protein ACFYSJ_05085 [Streptomyces sp. NPDC005248]|uniref:hypothetical protein n=1 Tax=Streptomyces sp. NPDC005248 TaxID=3364709 RepID=UPI003679DA36
MDFLPALGAVGLAGALTALLWFGTSGGGKMKPLGWGACLVLSMIAGAAYNAAGPPFDIVSSLVRDGVGMFTDVFPGYSMAALALTLLVIILYKKLTTRGVSMLGIVFWYVASGAGGGFSIVAAKIAVIMQGLA